MDFRWPIGQNEDRSIMSRRGELCAVKALGEVDPAGMCEVETVQSKPELGKCTPKSLKRAAINLHIYDKLNIFLILVFGLFFASSLSR
uniref:Transmembrane protein n=1 Tax=Panagrellus redivivus TaxID=6233 RepID=A0A7E4W3D4_PANRE